MSFRVIACWPAVRSHHWLRLLQARAIENQAYVIGVNRVGNEPGFVYGGRSVIIDYHGNIIADASDREGYATGILDLKSLNQYRQDLPFLRDIDR